MKKHRVMLILIVFLCFTFNVFLSAPSARAVSDPSGEATGTAADLGVEVETLDVKTLSDFVGHNSISINFIWVLLTGFLVMFMQAGFALVETGFCRAKNAAETMMMNFMVYGIGMAGYWICGYALQMGGVGGFASLGGNWVWGGGWLSQLGTNFGLGNGFVDFAGSSVVHAVGGFAGLAGATVLGARIGKYNKDGTPNAIPGHDIPMAILGTLILAFGWFGFNPRKHFSRCGSEDSCRGCQHHACLCSRLNQRHALYMVYNGQT